LLRHIMKSMLSAFAAQVRPALAGSTRLIALPRNPNFIAALLAIATLLCLSLPAPAQFTGQSQPLIGSGVVGQSQQTSSIAMSADGNTALFGGPANNSNTGAAWVFTRSAGIWTQQTQLVSPDPAAQFGNAVALSADGNTALIGGPGDSSNAGAVWVYTRSGGVWTQQTKLVSPDSAAQFGKAVALSADGSTALVGGPGDDTNVGAAWVFTYSGGMWGQQGKLLAGDAAGQALQGFSVSLSADGNTAMVGGYGDNTNTGAAWIFTRSGSMWTQQGSKLVGIGASGQAEQGYSVALSGDGSTAIMGGPSDNVQVGAAWLFTNSGGTWTQQGAKLVGSGFPVIFAEPPQQGFSVALSGDGNTAFVGGPYTGYFPRAFDGPGATWVFTRSGGTWGQQQMLVGVGGMSAITLQGFSAAISSDGKTGIVGGANPGVAWVFVERPLANTHDFNGDFRSDILWQNASGGLAMWLMNGGQVLQSASISTLGPTYSTTGSSSLGQHDFNGDGNADILWRDSNGNDWITFMNGVSPYSNPRGVGAIPTNFSVVGTGDLNGDGLGDLLWHDSNTGSLSAWLSNVSSGYSSTSYGVIPSTWTIAAEGNGYILWRDTAGDVARWQFQGGSVTQSLSLGNVPNNFIIAAAGDFNGDGYIDILWNDGNTGTLSIWFLGATGAQSAAVIATVASSWNVAQIGDYDGDGKSDILWLDTGGNLAMWLMNGTQVSSSIALGNVGTTWQVLNLNSN
jgi:FG-GAP-like repeat/FG-GAP repeat